MHTVHYPKVQASPPNADGSDFIKETGYLAAALGINFSVNKYTAVLSEAERMVIDNFFESLSWDDVSKTPVVSNLVAYGDLITLVDFDNRWVYQGSVTTPPCAQKVFWNEVSTIYPIKQSTLDNFKKQLDRPYAPTGGKSNADVYTGSSLSAVGNYREI